MILCPEVCQQPLKDCIQYSHTDYIHFFSGRALPTAVLTCILYGQGKWSNRFSSRHPSMISTATNSMSAGPGIDKMIHCSSFRFHLCTFFLPLQVFLLWAYRRRLQHLTAVPSPRSSLLQVRKLYTCILTDVHGCFFSVLLYRNGQSNHS